MTREEAIEELEDLGDVCLDFNVALSYKKKIAIDIAIDALIREHNLLDPGYQNATFDFCLGGRLFRAKEITQ